MKRLPVPTGRRGGIEGMAVVIDAKMAELNESIAAKNEQKALIIRGLFLKAGQIAEGNPSTVNFRAVDFLANAALYLMDAKTVGKLLEDRPEFRALGREKFDALQLNAGKIEKKPTRKTHKKRRGRPKKETIGEDESKPRAKMRGRIKAVDVIVQGVVPLEQNPVVQFYRSTMDFWIKGEGGFMVISVEDVKAMYEPRDGGKLVKQKRDNFFNNLLNSWWRSQPQTIRAFRQRGYLTAEHFAAFLEDTQDAQSAKKKKGKPGSFVLRTQLSTEEEQRALKKN